jgi:hypothetical protein
MLHRKYAKRMMDEHFKGAYYIGRHLLHFQDADQPPHRFYYIGHGDAFGVAMPESKRRWGFQIWGISWVRGRSNKLDKAIAAALKGKFPDCRHNVQVKKRAKQHGKKAFIKPTWIHEKPPLAFAKVSAAKLPIRGKGKRRRRKLNI